MALLLTFLAFEALLVLSIAMYVDGRGAAPSVWIRSDILLGVVANVAVTLLIFGLAGLVVTVMGWWQQGIQIAYWWAILASVVVTWWALKKLSVSLRLVSVAAMASAAATALPKVSDLVVPPGASPGNGAVAS